MDLSLLIDLHLPNPRQGPGSDAMTRRALSLAGLSDAQPLRVADIGCGTGAAALVLAEELDAQVTAVDLFPRFLAELRRRADERRPRSPIRTLEASMDALPFEPRSLDVMWSEGAIYNMGFEAGVAAWRQYLKPGGVLAVSEITWLTTERPPELQTFWDAAYAEIDVASAKLGILERSGFSPLGYFPLPECCWTDNYYDPLRARLPALLAEHDHSDAARDLVAAEQAEIALYERNKAHVSYGFYVARKR